MKKRNYFIVLFFTVLVVYWALKDDFSLIINQIFNVNMFYFLLVLVLVILFWMGKGLILYYNTYNFNDKFTFKRAFEITLKTQLFDNLTPFSSGGQPFEIYMLKKEGISLPESTGIILSNSLIYQISRTIICLIAVVINIVCDIIPVTNIMFILALVGIFVNLLLTIVYVLFLFNKRFSKLATKIIFKVMNKFKRDEFDDKKIENTLVNYHRVSKNIKENMFGFIKLIVINALAFVPLYLIPYVLFLSVGYNDISIVSVFNLCVLSTIAASFIPVPGSTGGSEYFFVQFMSFAVSSQINGVMLLWRFVTYYLSIIVGAIAFNRK